MSALQRRRLKKQEKENAAQDRRRGKCGKSDVHVWLNGAQPVQCSAVLCSSPVMNPPLLFIESKQYKFKKNRCRCADVGRSDDDVAGRRVSRLLLLLLHMYRCRQRRRRHPMCCRCRC